MSAERACQRCGAGVAGLDRRARFCDCCDSLGSEAYRAMAQYARASALADLLLGRAISAQAAAGVGAETWSIAQRILGWDKPPSEVTQSLAIVLMRERESARVPA